MEFKFNVNKLLPRKINKVTHTLIPEDFRGDRRELNGLGSVVGLLKTGSKNLFMFDETGAHYQLKPRCILDFYVHESRQRMGLGNILYQHMLSEEDIRPVKLAIDRPSEKFLAFLDKYYGLSKIIPQNNKFVVFRGFFDDGYEIARFELYTITLFNNIFVVYYFAERQDVRTNRYSLPAKTSVDIGASNVVHNNLGKSNSSLNGVPYSSSVSRSSFGRYAAARPPCSMANVNIKRFHFHENTSSIFPKSSAQWQHVPFTLVFRMYFHNIFMGSYFFSEKPSTPTATQLKPERPRSLSLYSEEEQKQRTSELSTVPTPALPDYQPTPLTTILRETEKTENNIKPSPSCSQEVAGSNQHNRLDLKFYHSPLW
ncbi:hypothetical protein E2986_06656 [Frieseomelitta varia]|uniref:N-acetyltransferase domain-containing protein n=2 Tax=Frieseomelitta varia TaxID=561572 RepID=A0A833S420_9HYME|nr:hypothetical protein E2986_06656 [Frieseomelitta varia]